MARGLYYFEQETHSYPHHDCDCEDEYLSSTCETEQKEQKPEYHRQVYEQLLRYQHRFYDIAEISLLEEIQLELLAENYLDSERTINFQAPQSKFKAVPREFYEFTIILIKKGLLIPSDYLKHYPSSLMDEHRNYKYSINLYHSDWIINLDLESPDRYLCELPQKKYNAEEKQILWQEVYREELRLFLKYQNDHYLNGRVDINLLDIFLDELMEHYSLAKTYTLLYFTTNSCLRYIQAFYPDQASLKTRFLDLLENNIKKNKDNPNLKDFNRPIFEISAVSQYIISNVFDAEFQYFYLKTKDILPPKTI